MSISIPDPQAPTLVGLALALAVAALGDVRERRIPNWLTGTIGAAGLLHASLAGGPGAALGALAGALVGAATLLVQFHFRLVGAGDVKLLAAVGAWVGPLRALYVLLGASALGGVLALVALARVSAAARARIGHNLLHVALTRDLAISQPSPESRAKGVPFGVALAIAALGVLALGVGS